jgi:NTE family protein
MRLIRRAGLGALFAAGLTGTAAGQACPPVRTALVLSGGGAKGIAHIGVLAALDSLGIRPDLVVGTSIGAIVGGLYASGYSAREIDSLARELPMEQIVRPFRVASPHAWDSRVPLLFLVRGRRRFAFETGLVMENQPNARLNAAMLRGNLLARGRFDRLPIPFRAIATDLRDRSTVVLAEGDLARAVRASSAIPLIFPPVLVGDSVLVDGGLSANIPIAEARAAGAERVIVSDVTEHLEDTLDVESPLALADQLLGFLFRQPEAALHPGDVMIRPAVQPFRSLDFSRSSVREILRRGRQAADSSLAAAACLPRGPRPPPVRPPTSLESWTVTTGPGPDSILIHRMLALGGQRRLDPARLRQRLIEIAEAEALRGIWLNPSGSGDTVRLAIEPIRAPGLVGGVGLAYDHELGGRVWAGLFDRRLFGTTLEASGTVAIGTLEREVAGTALWHTDAGWSRVAQLSTLRIRSEDIRRFDPDGESLPAIGTSEASFEAGLELRPARSWRVRTLGTVRSWGGEGIRGRSTVGATIRAARSGLDGLDLDLEATATTAYRLARLSGRWPLGDRTWSVLPVVRLGWATALVPLQSTFSLGGDAGFPGMHLGERRGTRELAGSVRIGRSLKGPLEARLLLAVGRAWFENVPDQDWLGGARIGVGADTPVGPIDVGYGAATNGRRAVFIRLGQWF